MHEHLSPGEETLISVPQDEEGNIVADHVWHANIHRYQRYAACMAGGDSILRPPAGTRHPMSGHGLADGSYLKRLPGETNADPARGDTFVARRNCAAHDPISWRIIGTYVDTVFRQTMDRAAVRDVLGDEVADNVDAQGTSSEDWLAAAYGQGLAQGWMIGVVDMQPSTGDYPSMAHQEAAAGRPYAQIILPSRVWGLLRDDRGQVVWALIHETQYTWRAWTSTGTMVYGEKGAVVQPFQPHGFSRVPMEVFVAKDPRDDDPDAPPGESAIQEISLLELQILQHLSLLDDVMRKTNFPFLHVAREAIGAGGPEQNQTLGADFMFLTEADCKWIAPPIDCVAGGREYIEWLEGLAYKIGGVHRRSMDSVEAHSGLALDWENAPIYATIQRWARRLRDWEIRMWHLMAEALGRDGSAIDVIYPDDFSTRPIEQDISQATDITSIYGGYASAPDWVKTGVDAMIRRALARTVGHIPEVRDGLETALEPQPDPEPVPVVVVQETDGDSEARFPGAPGEE